VSGNSHPPSVRFRRLVRRLLNVARTPSAPSTLGSASFTRRGRFRRIVARAPVFFCALLDKMLQVIGQIQVIGHSDYLDIGAG
jgi:hypothetical protein